MSAQRKGKNNAMWGKNHSINAINKMSKIVKKRYKNPKNHPWYGRKHTPETKKKMSQSRKGKSIGNNNVMFNKKRSWHGFRGAHYNNKTQNPWTRVWRATLRHNCKSNSLGLYEDPLSAEIVHLLVKEAIYGES